MHELYFYTLDMSDIAHLDGCFPVSTRVLRY